MEIETAQVFVPCHQHDANMMRVASLCCLRPNRYHRDRPEKEQDPVIEKSYSFLHFYGPLSNIDIMVEVHFVCLVTLVQLCNGV